MTQDQLRMQMLAGIITEDQYKAKVSDNLLDLVNLLNRIKKEIKIDKEGNEFNRLKWELDILDEDEFEEKFFIYYDDSTDITLVAGNGLLLSTDENDMKTQSTAMELEVPIGRGYYTVEINGTLIHYVFDPNQ